MSNSHPQFAITFMFNMNADEATKLRTVINNSRIKTTATNFQLFKLFFGVCLCEEESVVGRGLDSIGVHSSSAEEDAEASA